MTLLSRLSIVLFFVAACASDAPASPGQGGTPDDEGGSNVTGGTMSAPSGGATGAPGTAGVGGASGSGGSGGAGGSGGSAGLGAESGGEGGDPDPIAGEVGDSGVSSSDASVANGANSRPVPCGDVDCNDGNDCTWDDCQDGACRNEPWGSSVVVCEDEIGWGTCIADAPVCAWRCGEPGTFCCSEYKCRGGLQCDMTTTTCR